MEDDESFPQQNVVLTMEDKPLDAVEKVVERCESSTESIPELGDSQLPIAKSWIEAEEEEAVVEKYDSTVVVAKSPSGAEEVEDGEVCGETKAEGDKAEDGLEKCVSSFHDSSLGGDTAPNVAKDVEVEVEEAETRTDLLQFVGAGSPVDRGGEVEVAKGENLTAIECEVEGVNESQLVGVSLPNTNEVAADEIPQVGSGMKLENQDETKFAPEVECSVANFVSELGDSQLLAVEGCVLKSEPELNEFKLVRVESQKANEVEVDGISHCGAEMELENEFETKELGSRVENFVSELEDSQLLGVEGGVLKSDPCLNQSELADVEEPIAAEVAVDESLQGGNEMELENEVDTKELRSGVGELVSELDDSQLFGVGSSGAAKEDGDEEAMIKGESGMEDTEVEMELEAEVTKEVGTTSVPLLDNSHSVNADEDEGVEAEDEAPMVDTEMETETEVGETPEADKGGSGSGKRKRGKVAKVPARPPPRKKVIGEDVCFICFDGGDMVLCDRRGCPKAYHPSCVNRDEAFFRAKGRWNCGWHLCSHCEKNAHYMCYTCTFSLCKACIRDVAFFRVRSKKGFCETCMKTVMLIENNERAGKEDRVDFDDKSSWEYLFKDYWEDLKAKLSLSADELAQAKNPWKGSDILAGKQESPENVFDANNDRGSGSESSENLVASKPKRRKAKKRSKSLTKEEDLPSSSVLIDAGGTSIPSNTEWASKELLEFVMHMKNGDNSVLSQFDVQALLLEYIKRNKLRDPRKKSQIICDTRLENLFGKARVGHFEMLKLLESHFLVKEDSQPDDVQGSVVDTVVNHLEADGTIDAPQKGSKDRRRKMRRKGDERGPQSNLGDYAAIDIHNISLIYLRRKLVEDLLDDIERFHDKVFATFVRIRISGSTQNQDMYRLVQVVGTRKAAEPYKVGKKTADLVLEILNLNKTEVVSIDTISNQEFTEDECKRLRQSIKCGLIERLTVGDILDKAMEIQAARVNDWLETETVRLSHLCDRASDLGRKKELRECVEKLQLLKTPEERMRRLEEVPKIHVDPKMDPAYESEEEDSEMEDNKQEIYPRSRGSGFSRKGREPNSPHRGNFSPRDSGSSTRTSSGKNWETSRNISNKDFPIKNEEATLVGELRNENAWNQGRDKEASIMDKVNSATNSQNIGRDGHSFSRSESFSGAAASGTSQASLATVGIVETATKVNESEKMWHYQDPAGKVQGPFSLVQLRKWNSNGYFPVDLRIWRTTEKQDDALLLTDALAGKIFQKKELPPLDNNFIMSPQTLHSPHLSSAHAGKTYGASLHQGKESGESGIRSQREPTPSSGWATPSAEVPKVSADRLGSDYGRNDSTNLPSPTPMSSTPRWSSGPVAGVDQFPGGNGPTHSPVATSVNSGQLTQSGSREHTAMESLGVSTPISVRNPGRESIRGSETDSSSSLLVPKSEQGTFLGSTTGLPASQPQHGVQTQEMGAAPHQNAGTETTQAWGGASAQNSEPNPSHPGYGHWGGVPPAIQNPTGNFSAPAYPAFPQPDPWRPPVVANNQPNIQPAAPPNVPWGMGVAQNNAFAPAQNSVNTVWVPMQGNPNMGWVPAPGATNMNWVPSVQGNVNPGWVATPGNPGAMVQGIPPGNVNPGWAPQPGNPGSGLPQAGNGSGIPPVNGNPGWVAPTVNPGFNNVQGQAPGNVNPGWAPPTGNPGTSVQGSAPPVNANPGWGPPSAGNSGMRGNDNRHNGNNRFSGQRDSGGFSGGGQRDSGGFGGGRWNNRPPSGGGPKAPNTVCPFNKHGHCKKGSSCDMLHT